MKSKILVVAVVAVLAVAGVGAMLVLQQPSGEKKGLYQLDAKFAEVNMGQCSATPSVVLTIEKLYQSHYGDLVNPNVTIEDARADEAFWSNYGGWKSIITPKSDGTFDLKISTKAKGAETVNVGKMDTTVCMGTMYSETIYFLLCQKYGVKAYSQESFENQGIKDEMSKMISGGMSYSYFEENEAEFLTKFINKDTYLDVKAKSVQKIDAEELARVLNGAKEGGKQVIYLASGTRIAEEAHYVNNINPCINTGTKYAFFGPTSINEVYSSIDTIGKIMGFSDEVINKLIENVQVRLYAVFHSVSEKTKDMTEKPIVYWEAGNGKAVSASKMSKVIVNFVGFNDKLITGSEYDMESLLLEKPSMLIFYTNDSRSMDEKMRVA